MRRVLVLSFVMAAGAAALAAPGPFTVRDLVAMDRLSELASSAAHGRFGKQRLVIDIVAEAGQLGHIGRAGGNFQGLANPVNYVLHVFAGGPRLIFRRHRAQRKLLEHFHPQRLVDRGGRFRLELIQPNLALREFAAVALSAVLLQEWRNRAVKADGVGLLIGRRLGRK